MELNCFKDFRSKTPVKSTLEEVVRMIRTDSRLATLTARYRQSGSKPIKEQSTVFGVAAVFSGGKAEQHITAMTGLSLVDLDHVEEEKMEEVRTRVIADPHTLLCYTTISGFGVRIIFRYALDGKKSLGQQLRDYGEVFARGNDYYEQLTGVDADRQCKNVNRLSGLAHAPGVYYNPDAAAFTAGEMARIHHTHIDRGRHQKAIDRIARYYHGTIVPSLPPEAVFTPGSHNDHVMRVGYQLAKKRYAEADVLEWALREFKGYGDTESVIRSCYSSVREKPKNERSQLPAAEIGDIKSFLDGHVRLRQNIISGRVEYFDPEAKEIDEQWPPFVDRILNTLWAEMSESFKVRKDDINNVVNSVYTPFFHPFKDYFDRLPEWHAGDHDHIADLAATVKIRGNSSLDFSEVLRKWLVAMVASWFGKSTVNHVILVLIGEQGAYKTTWFNHLLPPELRRYFYTKVNINRTTRDEMVYLSRYALMCYEELDCMTAADLNRLKGIVTMEHVDEREPYARYAEHRPHIASFCGTGNNPQFLTDPTGNRRWMPFEVESIISPREQPLDYAGIYSQVYALYLSGFRHYFSQEEIKRQNVHNADFESPNLELELVSLYFRTPRNQGEAKFMTAARAMQIIGANIAQKLNPTRVTKAFRDLGFEPARCNNIRGFWVVERSAADMHDLPQGVSRET